MNMVYIFPSVYVFHLLFTVSEYRSFVSLSRFIPRYFILFDVMANGIASWVSLSDLSLLVYRNATDFCVFCNMQLYQIHWWFLVFFLAAFGSGRSPEEGNGYRLQYSCLENSMDRGAWWATVHGSQTAGQDWATNTFHFAVFRSV